MRQQQGGEAIWEAKACILQCHCIQLRKKGGEDVNWIDQL
jgi:hypothetical protein